MFYHSKYRYGFFAAGLDIRFKYSFPCCASYKKKIIAHNHLPHKIFTMGTKSWLFEEPGHEPVVLNIVDVFLFQCSLSAPVSKTQSEFPSVGGLVSFAEIIRGRVVVRHCFPGFLNKTLTDKWKNKSSLDPLTVDRYPRAADRTRLFQSRLRWEKARG